MRCGKLALCRVCRTGVDLVEDSNVRLQHRQLQDLIPFFLAACGLGTCLCSCTAAADQPRLLCKRRHSHCQSGCPAVASVVLNTPEQAAARCKNVLAPLPEHGGSSNDGRTGEALVDIAIQEGAVHFKRLQLWHKETVEF